MRFLVGKITKSSLVRQAMWAWVCIILLVLMSMAASLTIIQSIDGDAERINLSGSLRMQSYRIAEVLLLINHGDSRTVDDLRGALGEFEDRIETPILSELLEYNVESKERQALEEVIRQWGTLKNSLLGFQRVSELDIVSEIDRFVVHIDEMVGLFQVQTDYKIEQLRYIHGISIFLVVVIVFFALLNLYRTVVLPLRELVFAADKARQGDLSVRVSYLSNDELGLLGATFNSMASDLQVSYQELEERVERKTRQLQKQTDSLELLYETSRLINQGDTHVETIQPILSKLQSTIGFGEFRAYLTPHALEYVTSDSGVYHIEEDELDSRMLSDEGEWFRISDKNHRYGLLCWNSDAAIVAEEHRQLIAAVCEHMASAFTRDWKIDQTWRLLLVEERATIARELHDSLAQALSYLKMQVSRWQTLSDRNADKAQLVAITAEIRQGLNAAYGQLRELLTTFRLKLDEPGLESALKATVAEYRERGSLDVVLDYQLGDLAVRPNAEIHLLQIVREALSNVVRHAQATRAEISLGIEHDQILIVKITDNGAGLGDDNADSMHHGMTIMKERAHSLEAEIAINNGPGGGVTVRIDCDLEKIKRTGEMTKHDK